MPEILGSGFGFATHELSFGQALGKTLKQPEFCFLQVYKKNELSFFAVSQMRERQRRERQRQRFANYKSLSRWEERN